MKPVPATENVAHSSDGSASLQAIAPHRWRPGESGNPGGKSAAIEAAKQKIKRLCAEKSEHALGKVVALLESDDDRVVLMAAKEILVWGFGTLRQQEDDSDDKGSVTINIVRYGDSTPAQILSPRPATLS